MKRTFLAVTLLFTGCVSTAQLIQYEGQRAGAPQWQIDAIKHGCTSGESAAGNIFANYVKDHHQYDTNPQYKQYYEDHYRRCYNEWKNSVFNVRDNRW